MSELKRVQDIIIREYQNLNKSKSRSRTLQGILEKRQNLQDNFREYFRLVKECEHRLNVTEWNNLVDTFNEVKFKYSLSLQILDNSQIVVTSVPSPPIPNPNPEVIRKTLTPKPRPNSGKMTEGDEAVVEEPFIFPMKAAIQCIPDFTGRPEELDSFFYQADVYYELIPRDGDQKSLINVVLMKMKDDAMRFVKRVKAETYLQVKENIMKEFGGRKTIEEIQVQIENFEQGFDESYKDYKERALKLLEDIEALDSKDTAYAEKCLKIHFITGIKNRDLQISAKREKQKSFRELIQFLADENVECEQMAAIAKKLKVCRLAENKGKNSSFQGKSGHEDNNTQSQNDRRSNFQGTSGNYKSNNQFNQRGNFNRPDRNFNNSNGNSTNRNGYQSNKFSNNFNNQNRNFNNRFQGDNFGNRNQHFNNNGNFSSQGNNFAKQNAGNFQHRNYPNQNFQGYTNNCQNCDCENNFQGGNSNFSNNQIMEGLTGIIVINKKTNFWGIRSFSRPNTPS